MKYYKNLSIDESDFSVQRQGCRIHLTTTEYQLFITLLDHSGCICSRNFLLASAWNITVPIQTRTVDVHGQIKKDIGQILRKLCEQKDIEIIEAEACPDHIHMLISFSPKYSISYVMGYLKGKSSLMIFDRHANLKYKYGNRHFWARGYFVDTVGKNKQRIQEYIKRQLEQDQIADQLSLKEFTDPFTGSKGTKA